MLGAGTAVELPLVPNKMLCKRVSANFYNMEKEKERNS